MKWSELTFGNLSTGTSSLITLLTTGVVGSPCVPMPSFGDELCHAAEWRIQMVSIST